MTLEVRQLVVKSTVVEQDREKNQPKKDDCGDDKNSIQKKTLAQARRLIRESVYVRGER